MKILVLTNMYPNADKPYWGIFVKEQVDSYKKQYPESELDVLPLTDGSLVKRYILSSFKLLSKVLSNRPDVIHVHFGLTFLPLLLTLPFLKIADVKLVTTFHGSDILGANKLTRFVSKLAIMNSDAVIAVSEQIFNRISHRNKFYLPCGVAEQFIEFAEQSGSEETRNKLVVFPSSPSRPEKDFDKFQSIISQVESSIGKPVEYEVLENKSREQIAKLFTDARCLLMTSKHEGSPQVVKEAIYCDLPVISTDVGDVKKLIQQNSYCTVSDSEKSLSQAVAKLLSINFLKGADYCSESKQKLSNKTVTKQLQKIYSDLKR